MTNPSPSASTSWPFVGTELFRPSLQYPIYPYAEMLTLTAERYPEQVALVFQEVYLTYRELNALVNSLANALLDVGIHQGQRVGLLMANRPEFVISWFAITRIGAVSCPLNPAHKEREIAYQLANSEAVALIVQHELLPLVEAVQEQTPELRYLLVVGPEQSSPKEQIYSFNRLLASYPSTPFAGGNPSWEDLAALPYSSGTTGLPKGVMLSHKNLVVNACQSIATAHITFADRMLSFIPLYHIYGIMLMGCAAMSGARLVLMERFEPGRWLQLIQEQHATIVYSVPYVTITDRKKEMIKYKGFSIAPAQIEAILLEHPAVADVAVVARADKEAGEIPKAFIVLRRGYENQSADELLAWINGKLATYKNVRAIEYIEAIPRNPSGKILRRILKEQDH